MRSLAERIATGLDLAHIPAVVTTRTTAPQHEMENSAQQHRNVLDAYTTVEPVPSGAVLLIDDIADSRWTLTEVGGVLRAAGVAAVIPVTLAQGGAD